MPINWECYNESIRRLLAGDGEGSQHITAEDCDIDTSFLGSMDLLLPDANYLDGRQSNGDSRGGDFVDLQQIKVSPIDNSDDSFGQSEESKFVPSFIARKTHSTDSPKNTSAFPIAGTAQLESKRMWKRKHDDLRNSPVNPQSFLATRRQYDQSVKQLQTQADMPTFETLQRRKRRLGENFVGMSSVESPSDGRRSDCSSLQIDSAAHVVSKSSQRQDTLPPQSDSSAKRNSPTPLWQSRRTGRNMSCFATAMGILGMPHTRNSLVRPVIYSEGTPARNPDEIANPLSPEIDISKFSRNYNDKVVKQSEVLENAGSRGDFSQRKTIRAAEANDNCSGGKSGEGYVREYRLPWREQSGNSYKIKAKALGLCEAKPFQRGENYWDTKLGCDEI
jgi:hypothetical protein